MYMDPEKNPQADDFNFDDFISEETKKDLGISETGLQTNDVPVDSSTTPQEESQKIEEQAPDTIVQEDVTQKAESIDENSAPVRAANEPDWKYEYRLEIYNKQQELKTASTEEEKKEIKNDISGIRKSLAEKSSPKITEQADQDDTVDIDPDVLKNDVDYIKVVAEKAGYAKIEDIPTLIKEVQRIERETLAVDSAEQKFLSRHPEYRDQRKYDQFIEFVGENFKLPGKSEAAIQNILETAHSWLNPKSFEDKVAAAVNLEKTLDSVDFSGSTKNEEVNPEKLESKTLVESIKGQSGTDFSWILD